MDKTEGLLVMAQTEGQGLWLAGRAYSVGIDPRKEYVIQGWAWQNHLVVR